MSKTRTIALVVAGFVAGLAFVVACGDDVMHMIDAGRADAGSCEPPITVERIYHVTTTETAQFSAPGSGVTLLRATAQCNAGDIVISGSCYVYSEPPLDDYNDIARGEHRLIAAGVQPAVGTLPAQNDRYRCVYEGGGFPTKVYATATCFKVSMQ
jgi:hypothetical protein